MTSSKPYVYPNRCCSRVSVVSGSSGCQEEKSFRSGLLFVAFNLLRRIADHESLNSRLCFYAWLCLRFTKEERLSEPVHFAMRLCPEFEALRRIIFTAIHFTVSPKQWVNSFLRRHIWECCHHLLFQLSLLHDQLLLQPHIIFLLLVILPLADHPLAGHWTKDSCLVGVQRSCNGTTRNLGTWFLLARLKKVFMVHILYTISSLQFMCLYLHKFHNPQQGLYLLISSHRLPHIFHRAWVSLEHLLRPRPLTSLLCLLILEVPLPGYLTQMPHVIWPLVILSLHNPLIFLIPFIYTQLMVIILQSLNLMNLMVD